MNSQILKLSIALLLLIGRHTISFSQDMDRVRTTIDTLCSKEMFGRGYVKNGANRAATFLGNNFEEIGLKSFGNSYFQEFIFPVNTFPDRCELIIEDKSLTLGEDFLPHSASASGRAENAPLLRFDTLSLKNPSQLDSLLQKSQIDNKIVCLDAQWEKWLGQLSRRAIQSLFNQPKAILFSTTKLTHGVSTIQYAKPIFYIKKSALNKVEDVSPLRSSFRTDAELISSMSSKNIIGFVKGTNQSDSLVVFTAHYDHLGGIGNSVFFPGANDNASGVAMLLELADWYAKNPPKNDIAFIAFSAEEAGLIGSKFFTENPLFPLKNIKVLFNIDLFATGEKGCTIVNGKEFPNDFDTFVSLNQKHNALEKILPRGSAANSDHYFFHKNGVKSFFVYLMGDWPHYHDVNDKPPVPLSEFRDSFKLLSEMEKVY